MIVQRPGQHAGRRSDLANRRSFKSFAREKSRRRSNDPPTTVGASSQRFRFLLAALRAPCGLRHSLVSRQRKIGGVHRFRSPSVYTFEQILSRIAGVQSAHRPRNSLSLTSVLTSDVAPRHRPSASVLPAPAIFDRSKHERSGRHANTASRRGAGPIATRWVRRQRQPSTPNSWLPPRPSVPARRSAYRTLAIQPSER